MVLAKFNFGEKFKQKNGFHKVCEAIFQYD